MVRLRPYAPGDRAWVTGANLRFYREVHGFDATFAGAVRGALDHVEALLAEPASACLVAEVSGRRAGCIFLSPEAHGAARIRLFYVDASARGRGLGTRLLTGVLEHARAGNLERVRVSTFDRHPEACRLYARFGFETVADRPAKAFGQSMRQLDYELRLARDDRN